MDIATLEAKKTVLVAQRDQLMANFNASLGAIAMCDELLGELYRAAETQKQLDQVARDMAAEAQAKSRQERPAPPLDAPLHIAGSCPGCPCTDLCDDEGCQGDLRVIEVAAAPEMLPVLHEDEAVEIECIDISRKFVAPVSDPA